MLARLWAAAVVLLRAGFRRRTRLAAIAAQWAEVDRRNSRRFRRQTTLQWAEAAAAAAAGCLPTDRLGPRFRKRSRLARSTTTHRACRSHLTRRRAVAVIKRRTCRAQCQQAAFDRRRRPSTRSTAAARGHRHRNRQCVRSRRESITASIR